jgi:hypothetical protein
VRRPGHLDHAVPAPGEAAGAVGAGQVERLLPRRLPHAPLGEPLREASPFAAGETAEDDANVREAHHPRSVTRLDRPRTKAGTRGDRFRRKRLNLLGRTTPKGRHCPCRTRLVAAVSGDVCLLPEGYVTTRARARAAATPELDYVSFTNDQGEITKMAVVKPALPALLHDGDATGGDDRSGSVTRIQGAPDPSPSVTTIRRDALVPPALAPLPTPFAMAMPDFVGDRPSALTRIAPLERPPAQRLAPLPMAAPLAPPVRRGPPPWALALAAALPIAVVAFGTVLLGARLTGESAGPLPPPEPPPELRAAPAALLPSPAPWTPTAPPPVVVIEANAPAAPASITPPTAHAARPGRAWAAPPTRSDTRPAARGPRRAHGSRAPRPVAR